MAPTSGTNTTFGGRIAMGPIKSRGEARCRRGIRPAITIAFSAGQKAAGQVCALP